MKTRRASIIRAFAITIAWPLLIMSNGVGATESELASIARGGRLYENWTKELGAGAVRAFQRDADRGRGLPGRCVDCHGWDYRGKDGRTAAPGMSKGMGALRGAGRDRIRAILGDARHGYAEAMKEADLDDLAAFVAKGQVDMDALIDPANARARGDAKKGDAVLQTICVNCHGNDGQQINDAPPLGDTVRSNPWRGLHTLLNGHPHGNMPSLRAMGDGLAVDILAAAQELPSRNLLASIVRGGRLYDTWYKEIKSEPPKGVHPAYPIPLAREIEPRTTWRCKECHGWDNRGWKGASEGKEYVIKGVDRTLGADPARVAEAIRGDVHAMRGLLSDRDVSDLANFLTRGQSRIDGLIDPGTKKATVDAHRYESHYQTICAACHGADGREIRTMPPVGRIASQDPWRALHGIVNGHPGEAMPALAGFPREVSVGILAYAQTLPQNR